MTEPRIAPQIQFFIRERSAQQRCNGVVKWRLCDLLIERDVVVPWQCYSRVDGIDRPLLLKMRAAGCTGLIFGIESGSQRILDEVLQKDIDLNQVDNVLTLCDELGLWKTLDFIIGHPSETPEELGATMRLIRSQRGPRTSIFWSILLIYPGTDMVTARPALELFDRGAFLTAEDREWYHGNYVTAEQRGDPRASPLLAEDLSGLPPALVVTAGFDPLRDEGRAYAEALRAAGSPAVLRHHPGMPHAFASMTGVSPAARDAVSGKSVTVTRREALELALPGRGWRLIEIREH